MNWNSMKKENWKTCDYNEHKQEVDYNGSFQIQNFSS